VIGERKWMADRVSSPWIGVIFLKLLGPQLWLVQVRPSYQCMQRAQI
jgi:hypothetical protein